MKNAIVSIATWLVMISLSVGLVLLAAAFAVWAGKVLWRLLLS